MASSQQVPAAGRAGDEDRDVIALFKAVPLGIALTLLVALFVGSAGSSGGVLDVFSFTLEGARLYWSWALFCLATALAWALLLLMDD